MAQEGAKVRPWQRLVQRIASLRVVSWIFSHTLHYLDRILMRLSGGRVSIPRQLAGLPVVQLTTIGAKTGKERTVPLVGLRDGEDWVLVASNWGSERHPAWYHNLQANPAVELTHDEETERYVARDATEEERAEYWERASELYPGYEAYRERSGDRQIPIVVLEPAEE